MIYAEYKRKFPFFSMALGYVYFPLLDARHAFVFLFSLFSFCIRRVPRTTDIRCRSWWILIWIEQTHVFMVFYSHFVSFLVTCVVDWVFL